MVVRVLETSFSGALLTAGMGHMSFRDIPEFLADAAELMVGPAAEPAAAGAEPGDADDHHQPAGVLQPLRL